MQEKIWRYKGLKEYISFNKIINSETRKIKFLDIAQKYLKAILN